MRKTLLLSDVPPCSEWTAGLFLHTLCRVVPEGSLSCFSVVEPATNVPIPAELGWMPRASHVGPHDRFSLPVSRPALRWAIRPVESLLQLAYYSLVYPRRMRSLISSIVAFGRANKVEALWCLLQRPTLIRLAVPVAQALNVPLLTQVLDPPTWWLRSIKLNRFATRQFLSYFDWALSSSECCAAASWNMAEAYTQQYGIKAIPVIPSLDPGVAQPAARRPGSDSQVRICIAGQIYANAEWFTLLRGLEAANWQIAGRQVIVQVLGRRSPPEITVNKGARIEFLGWHSQADTIRMLAQADILYCPYWFDPEFKLESSQSFPSKLTSYLASGRPVLFHGPAYASPASFLNKHDAGLACTSEDPRDIVRCLERLVTDEELYARLARRGRQAFLEHLTTDVMRGSFARFLGIAETQLRAAA